MHATHRDLPQSVRVAAVLAAVAAVCGLLYWGQLVFIPLAMAGLLTFLLTPAVARIERWGLGRVPAVVLVVGAAALVLALVGWSVSAQVTSFAADLPGYKDNIKAKVADLQAMLRGGALEKVQKTLADVTKELEREDGKQPPKSPEEYLDAAESGEAEPIPVRIAPEKSPLPSLGSLSPILPVLGSAGLAIVLVFFMLIYREDVVSRLVSLAGTRSLAVTTRALDEASRRISRYLLMQLVINASYGLAVGAGLFLLGVPYSFLWGLGGFILRYIPYVGPWIAALLPIGVSLVHFTGWTTVLLVIGLFIALELVTNNVLEPLLYGHSVGLSPVAVIVAAAFWTWMWGTIGLVLATPLTVCLVVLGEHIPAMSIFDRLLSDQPALKPHLWLYQRLLAGDEEDADQIVEKHLDEHSPQATCDELLLPTLLVARRERAARRIDDDDMEQIESILGEVVDGLPHWNIAPPAAEPSTAATEPRPPALAMGFPMHQADVLVLNLLARLLNPAKCKLEVLSINMLISERILQIDQEQPALVFVSSLPPGGWAQTRALCKSLRARYPDLKIVVGRWTGKSVSEKNRELLHESGATATVSTLLEACEAVAPIIQLHTAAKAPSPTKDFAMVSA